MYKFLIIAYLFTLEGSRPDSIFKFPASEMLIWGISGTKGLNVPGIFSSLRVPSASPSSTALSERWFILKSETVVKTDCMWLLIRLALSEFDALVFG